MWTIGHWADRAKWKMARSGINAVATPGLKAVPERRKAGPHKVLTGFGRITATRNTTGNAQVVEYSVDILLLIAPAPGSKGAHRRRRRIGEKLWVSHLF